MGGGEGGDYRGNFALCGKAQFNVVNHTLLSLLNRLCNSYFLVAKLRIVDRLLSLED